MKILYLTDNYTYSNYGIKRSLFEAIQDIGWEIIWIDIKHLNNLLSLIEEHNPQQVWCAHSNLRLKPEIKAQIKIPIIGFGFSDPYYFSQDRFNSYTAYVTNHYETYQKFQKKIIMHYMPTSCDLKFHKKLDIEKDLGITFIGLANHPRFKKSNERIELVNEIRDQGIKISTFGHGWPKHKDSYDYITGEEFRQVINRSILGLDLQETFSPLSHRMFEYPACGVPVITRERPELFKHFEKDDEIFTYVDNKDLVFKLKVLTSDIEKIYEVGENAYQKCRSDHTIHKRIIPLLQFIKENEI